MGAHVSQEDQCLSFSHCVASGHVSKNIICARGVGDRFGKLDSCLSGLDELVVLKEILHARALQLLVESMSKVGWSSP